ncbi:MAG: hypothetical protein HND53_11810 [Proteobacteria bacterium]|nr:hypothetical protein [Pseudomonadota bacterium]NOG61179.1 hypothetical protein [Pseudomonadota bacterium]
MSDVVSILNNLHKIDAQKQPGNLVERIMQSMTLKKKQQAMVHPCIIDGKHTLVYEHGLEQKDPFAFQKIVEFSRKQGYELKEDQRADFLEGVKRVKNRHHANVVSVMMLTAGLMSQTAQAKSSFGHDHDTHLDNDVTQTHVEPGFDFDFDSYKSQDELVSGLLGWINSHSSFEYNIDTLPDIKKVSARQIAVVAFGGKLPKAVNPENLQIFGLYNFNEKAVYLLDTIDLDTDEGKGILLHELVHYLQYQTGLDDNVKCKNELESLAYVLEAKFLESHDHKHNISQSHIQKVSQCRV